MFDIPSWLPPILGLAILAAVVILRLQTANQIRTRLSDEDEPLEEPTENTASRSEPATGLISNWLYLAGFRSPNATITFVAATTGLALVGGIVMYRIHSEGTVDQIANLVSAIPGGVGNVIIPFVLAMPWFVWTVILLLPMLFVRAVRRQRVQLIEEDLPLVLDLLNTLAQAGIGFDAALDRILDAQSADRPLIQELRTFQYDLLAGRPRIESLRRLARRINVATFSTFISAIIQSEQVGAGIAQTLRIQAADFRSRRREKAMAAAMTVPSKLIVPMVIGFLPGVFVALMGPLLFQALQMLDRTMRGVGGGG
ncbi:MAG: hypothetical protein CMJ78_19700 [Planctomycetaceae bacterium]|nr:hypothetical protein [Planctomycetaceae bacterium]